MSYFHETIWKGVPKFLRRVDTALKNIGINERVPYNAPLIQFSSWMGGDRDGIFLFPKKLMNKIVLHKPAFSLLSLLLMWYRFKISSPQIHDASYLLCSFLFQVLTLIFNVGHRFRGMACNRIIICFLTICLMSIAGNPRVTPEVTRDVCLLARMMAANLYFSQIEDLMFEVSNMLFTVLIIIIFF